MSAGENREAGASLRAQLEALEAVVREIGHDDVMRKSGMLPTALSLCRRAVEEVDRYERAFVDAKNVVAATATEALMAYNTDALRAEIASLRAEYEDMKTCIRGSASQDIRAYLDGSGLPDTKGE